jgi:hypothetical protein
MTASFIACNARRNNKLEKGNGVLSESALRDTTQVELIDSVFNFGVINEGEKVSYNFRFKNVGNKSLIIINASASCGCTIPEKPENPIPPGDTGIIKVSFNSAGKKGFNSKFISVEANTDPAFPILMLAGEVMELK